MRPIALTRILITLLSLLAAGATPSKAALMQLKMYVSTTENSLPMSDLDYGSAENLAIGNEFMVVANLYRSKGLFQYQNFNPSYNGASGDEWPLGSFYVFVGDEIVGQESSVSSQISTIDYRVNGSSLTGPSAFELAFSFDWRSGTGFLSLYGRYLDSPTTLAPNPILRGDIFAYETISPSHPIPDQGSTRLLAILVLPFLAWLRYRLISNTAN